MDSFSLLPLSFNLITSSKKKKTITEKNINKADFKLKLQHPLVLPFQTPTCTSISHFKQIHAQMITTGHIHGSFIYRRLIAFCALSPHGNLDYATKLFTQIKYPNLFVWNVMIRGYSGSNWAECLLLYVRMLRSGFVPDEYTFPFLLKTCGRLLMDSEGLQIHAHVVKFGLWSDPYATNALITMYLDFGLVDVARRVFDAVPARDETAWETLIVGLASSKDYTAEALTFFRSIDWKNMKVDSVVLVSVLSACAKLKNLMLGKEIHKYIERNGVEMNLVLGNSLVNMYAKCSKMETASLIFYGMLETDLISWTTLISGYLDHGNFLKSLELVSKMKARNIRCDEGTLLKLISACNELESGLVIHGLIRDMSFESSLSICSAVISMYSRIGFVERAIEVFDSMLERDLVTWNSMLSGFIRSGLMQMAHSLFVQMPEKDNYSWSTMITGYVKNGLPEKAMEIYQELIMDSSVKPDRITILNVLSACSILGALKEGEYAHLYLERNGIDIGIALGTALIDMYAKCGCFDKALKVFDGLKKKDDARVWTALISCLAMHGRGKEALLSFRKMQSTRDESVKPNSVTILSVLSACVHAGLVEDGIEIYQQMKLKYSIEPDLQHNCCMVDLFGRAGLLKQAMGFIEGLGTNVDIAIWMALLGACRTHGNAEIGEIAMKKILELDPLHDGAHVLMSNIYMEAGRITESSELRKKMKDENVGKEVGRSWIEVDGVRHEFTAGDAISERHHKTKQVKKTINCSSVS